VENKLIEMLQYDPAPMVRRSVLAHIPLSTSTIAAIVSRCRDEDPSTRKAVYKMLSVHIKSFDQLGSSFLNSVLGNGLRDPDAGVRKSCVELVTKWVDGSVINLARLLAILNVVKSPVSEDIVMECLRHSKSNSESTKSDQVNLMKLNFTDDFWRNLTPETALVLRCSLDISENAEEFSVEKLAYFLQFHTNQMITNMDESLDDAYVYVVHEILKICAKMDYSDPHGSRLMFALVRNMMASIAVPEELIPPLIDLFRLICIDERDFIRVVNEIVSDILDSCMKDSGDSKVESEDASNDELFRCLKCLLIVRKALEASSLGWTNEAFSSMHGVLGELIEPALQRYSDIGVVVANAIACRGLVAISSQKHATMFFDSFIAYAGVECATDEELIEVVSTSLRVIFDLLLLFGSITLNADMSKVITVLQNSLKSPLRVLELLTVEGCIKLLLGGRIDSDEVRA
jgi:condensin complex subunit 3